MESEILNIMNHKIRFTKGSTFRSKGKWVPGDRIETSIDITLKELVGIFSNPKIVEDFEEPKSWQKGKDNYWYNFVIPCDIQEGKTIDNIYRITAVQLDIDGPKVYSTQDVVNIFKENFPYYFIVYTTYSHYDKSYTDKEPRLRVIVPLKQAIKADEYNLAVNTILYNSRYLDVTDTQQIMKKDKGIDTSMFSPEHCSFAPVTARKDKYYICCNGQSNQLFNFYDFIN